MLITNIPIGLFWRLSIQQIQSVFNAVMFESEGVTCLIDIYAPLPESATQKKIKVSYQG